MKKTKFNQPNASRTPPLSILDKSIYILIIVLSALLFISLYILFRFLKIDLASKDADTVAYSFIASELFSLPFLLYFEISLIVANAVLFSKKIPIFGNRKIEYGTFPWDKNIYPLFDKRRKLVYVNPSTKKFRKTLVSIWCIVLCVTMLFVPISIFGRDCLQSDNSIVFYDVFGRRSEKTYATSDYSTLEIGARFVPQGKGVTGYWDFSIKIKMTDGKNIMYSGKDFFGDTTSIIKKMIEIKKLFPSYKITISGKNNLQKVEKEYKMNEKEIKLLEELFDE